MWTRLIHYKGGREKEKKTYICMCSMCTMVMWPKAMRAMVMCGGVCNHVVAMTSVAVVHVRHVYVWRMVHTIMVHNAVVHMAVIHVGMVHRTMIHVAVIHLAVVHVSVVHNCHWLRSSVNHGKLRFNCNVSEQFDKFSFTRVDNFTCSLTDWK